MLIAGTLVKAFHTAEVGMRKIVVTEVDESLLRVQGYGGDYQREDNLTAYQALVDEGITFIDTAEVKAFPLLLAIQFERVNS